MVTRATTIRYKTRGDGVSVTRTVARVTYTTRVNDAVPISRVREIRHDVVTIAMLLVFASVMAALGTQMALFAVMGASIRGMGDIIDGVVTKSRTKS